MLAGLVGFIGLIVPHIARGASSDRMPARSYLAAAAIGAALCMLADAACRRIVAPAELPIGVLLAFIGVPALLYLYFLALQRRSGWEREKPCPESSMYTAGCRRRSAGKER